MKDTRKTLAILIVFLVVLVIIALLIINADTANKSQQTQPTVTPIHTVAATPQPTQQPTAEPTAEPTVLITPTPDTTVKIAPGYVPNNPVILGISAGMSIIDVVEMWGDPLDSSKEEVTDFGGTMITYFYDFGSVDFFQYDTQSFGEAKVVYISVQNAEYDGVVGIKTGDSIYDVTQKLALSMDYINQGQEQIYNNETQVGRISYLDAVPDGIWLYSMEEEGLGVYVLFSGGYVQSHGSYILLD